jgi:hypothetical protein
MDHRYGRHGAGAWLRWHARHSYVHRSLDIVPVAQADVIYMHVPTNMMIERIIIIVTNPLPLPLPSVDDDAIVFMAQRTASKQAKNDIVEDTIASNEEIEQLAQDAWEQIDEEKIINAKGNRTFSDVERLFQHTYVATYLQTIEQANARPADRVLRTIRRIAYRDREQDENIVSDDYLLIQATIRVYPQAQHSPQEKLAYLEEIAHLARVYIDHYHEYPGRDGRLSRQSTFPSESRW